MPKLSIHSLIFLSLIAVYVSLFYYLGSKNLYLGYSVTLGILSFPFLVQVGKQKINYGYLIIAILSGLGAWWSGSFTLFYFTFSFGLCFILSSYLGQINKLPIFLLMVISPLVSYLTAMYSFPIRLHLSEAVSFVLSGIGFDIVSEGNLLIIAGEKFLVDQECVGLKMLITGMVLVLIVLAYYERKHHQQFGWRQIILAQVIGFVFNILANFSRIIILVLFKIGPEKIMHDLVGIACLLSYNLLPIVLLVSQWTPKSNNIIQTKPIRSFNLKYVLYFPLLMILLFLGGGSIFQENHNFTTHINNPLLDGLQKEQLENNILQYSNKDILVYVKPPASPFRGTHDPRFCWRGSGYELKVIKQEKQNGYSIYTGELIKGSDKIYTAWWYQDGLTITNSEWAWRTKSVLNSKAFSLININADTKSSLNQAVRDYLGALAK